MSQRLQDTFPTRQMRLGFPTHALRLPDMDETPANRAALSLLSRSFEWPVGVLCLAGPSHCGLTSFAQAWIRAEQGRFLSATEVDELSIADMPFFASGAVAIDNANFVRTEENLLALINVSRALGGRLLLTSHVLPSVWATQSPDLRSRLVSIPVSEILPPDDTTLDIWFTALCRRHYVKPDSEVRQFLIPRLDREYSAIYKLVTALDAEMSNTGRSLTIPFVKHIFSQLEDGLI